MRKTLFIFFSIEENVLKPFFATSDYVKSHNVACITPSFNNIRYPLKTSYYDIKNPIDILGEHHTRRIFNDVYDWQAHLGGTPLENHTDLEDCFRLSSSGPSGYLGWVLRFTPIIQTRYLVIDTILTALENHDPDEVVFAGIGETVYWHRDIAMKCVKSRSPNATFLEFEDILEGDLRKTYLDIKNAALAKLEAEKNEREKRARDILEKRENQRKEAAARAQARVQARAKAVAKRDAIVLERQLTREQNILEAAKIAKQNIKAREAAQAEAKSIAKAKAEAKREALEYERALAREQKTIAALKTAEEKARARKRIAREKERLAQEKMETAKAAAKEAAQEKARDRAAIRLEKQMIAKAKAQAKGDAVKRERQLAREAKILEAAKIAKQNIKAREAAQAEAKSIAKAKAEAKREALEYERALAREQKTIAALKTAEEKARARKRIAREKERLAQEKMETAKAAAKEAAQEKARDRAAIRLEKQMIAKANAEAKREAVEYERGIAREQKIISAMETAKQKLQDREDQQARIAQQKTEEREQLLKQARIFNFNNYAIRSSGRDYERFQNHPIFDTPPPSRKIISGISRLAIYLPANKPSESKNASKAKTKRHEILLRAMRLSETLIIYLREPQDNELVAIQTLKNLEAILDSWWPIPLTYRSRKPLADKSELKNTQFLNSRIRFALARFIMEYDRDAGFLKDDKTLLPSKIQDRLKIRKAAIVRTFNAVHLARQSVLEYLKS